MHRKEKHRIGSQRKQHYNSTGAYRNKGAFEAYYKKRISLPFLMHRRGRIT